MKTNHRRKNRSRSYLSRVSSIWRQVSRESARSERTRDLQKARSVVRMPNDFWEEIDLPLFEPRYARGEDIWSFD